MKITIHRGTNQIGGCVTEYECKGWRLFVDYGEQLPGSSSDKDLEIEGLTCGDLSKSALLITHYHGDHVGKIADLPSELPIYMGKVACEVLKTLSEHCGYVSESQKRLAERLDDVNMFSPGELIEFGEFKIMPITIDHSAFDAYAFKIEAAGIKVFHTGDFRTHGFRGSVLPKVIEKFIGKVDYVVCEATNIDRPQATSKPEYELQKEFKQEFKENKYNIVYLSSTNIDRLFALYHAALEAGLPFYVDAYQKHIMDIVTQRDNVWGKSRLYKYGKYEPVVLLRDGQDFLYKKEFDDFLREKGYVLIARANDAFDNLIAKMPGDNKQIYLSMWKGYVDPQKEAFNEKLSNSVGCNFHYMHTSGHCDMEALGNLLAQVSPMAIIPIHTDDPKAFAELFCDRWPIMLLNDGESFSQIQDDSYDNLTANIIAVKKEAEDIEVIENDGDYEWYAIDEKRIGEFKNTEDALFALQRTVYAPDRILGYSIEECEDFEPWDYVVYNPDFSVNAVYKYGSHKPGKTDYQEPCRFNSGEKVLAAIYPYYNAVIPCEVIGPVTDKLMYEDFKSDPLTLSQSYREYKEDLRGWDWDVVAVRPLVRIEVKDFVKMRSTELVARVFLFPFRNFNIDENSASV